MDRIVLHSDLNNFYASVECLYNPRLRDVPMAVTGDPDNRHGIILSKNEKAKAFGVKTGEAIWEARQKCRDIICIPPRFGEYMHFSRMVRDIYKRYTPRVEPFGLDEAWIDVTGEAADAAGFCDELRKVVRTETGLTVSIGASFNKVFAKLGSDMKKPDATTVITRGDFRGKVWPLAVEELLYVGRATKRKLNRIGVMTIGDLANTPETVARALLGKWGAVLRRYARGEDDSPVAYFDETVPVKSVGNSSTPPRDLRNDEDMRCMFYLLADSVAGRLRAHGLMCSVVSISVRDCKLMSFTRQTRLKEPTSAAADIAAAAIELFRRNYRWERHVRSVGVSGCALTDAHAARQTTCFDDDERLRARKEKLESAMHEIRRRFGNGAVQRAVVMGSDFGRMDPKDENVIFPAGFIDAGEVW